MRRWLYWWGPVAVMMALIALFSTDLFSSANTRWLVKLLLSLFDWRLRPWEPEAAYTPGEGWLRKSAHFTEYALLAASVFRALRGVVPERGRWFWAAGALAWTIAWASLDEYSQHAHILSTDRTGSVWDVVIDASGGMAAVVILLVCSSYAPGRVSTD